MHLYNRITFIRENTILNMLNKSLNKLIAQKLKKKVMNDLYIYQHVKAITEFLYQI